MLSAAASLASVVLVACVAGPSGSNEPVDPDEHVAEVQSAVEAGACTPGVAMPPSCSPSCAYKHCGGILWTGHVVPFQITQNRGIYSFSAPMMQRIRDMAAAWSAASNNVAEWVECSTYPCSGYSRYLDIAPNSGNSGIYDAATTGANHMLLAENEASTYVAHELGHALNLPHTWNRFDRDRYVEFSPYFCSSQAEANSLWKCMAEPSSDPAFAAIPTGQFGVYDETSVMNYISPDICENNGQEPGPNQGPTEADGAAVAELYRVPARWAPFQSLGADVGPYQGLDYNLAAGVTMVGSPGVCSWGAPLLDVFARGSDGHIYYKYKNVSAGTFTSWSSWVDMGSGFSGDPAAVSWASGRTDLVAAKPDGNIYIRSHLSTGWSGWSSLGAPSVGLGSDPAISSWGTNRLDVFVRGADGYLYQRTYTGTWGSWAQIGGGTFLGKPAAVSWGSNRIDVVVHGLDHQLWTIWFDTSGWHSYYSLGVTLYSSGGVNASPTIASRGADLLDIFLRGADKQLWQKAWTGSWSGAIPLGGLMTGDPAAVGKSSPTARLDIVAPNVDHGAQGVWWKYFPYDRPCYREGASCGACGE